MLCQQSTRLHQSCCEEPDHLKMIKQDDETGSQKATVYVRLQ